jgi:hypothetical protein
MKKPRHATHVKLSTTFEGTKRKAILDIKDMDCIAGCPGTVTYLRQLRDKTYEELGAFEFDGEWPIKEKEKKIITIKFVNKNENE